MVLQVQLLPNLINRTSGVSWDVEDTDTASSVPGLDRRTLVINEKVTDVVLDSPVLLVRRVDDDDRLGLRIEVPLDPALLTLLGGGCTLAATYRG